MMKDFETHLFMFFKALGQPERLAIVGQLLQEPLSVPELSRRLDIKEIDLLRHLAVLQKSGLVIGSEEAYRFDSDRLHEMNRAVWSAVRPPQPTPEDSDEAIVQRFVQDGKLREFPAKENKLSIVLRWVADQVPPDTTFTEREISDLLTTIHEDYAMLRRYLVDYGLMARDRGTYWRIAS